MLSTTMRRLRGIAGTMFTWALGGAAAGALFGTALSAVLLVPRGMLEHVPQIIVGLGLVGGIVGAMTGGGFALLLTLAARHRSLDELRTWQTGALGAGAAVTVAWLISSSPMLAAAWGAFGFSVAAGSLVVARRALPAGDEPHAALASGE